MKQQRSKLFDKLIPIFVQTTKVFENRNSNDLRNEAIRYSKCKLGKSGIKLMEFTTKVSKFSNVFYV